MLIASSRIDQRRPGRGLPTVATEPRSAAGSCSSGVGAGRFNAILSSHWIQSAQQFQSAQQVVRLSLHGYPRGHVYLTGYRGTGKTSVGAILAHSLGRAVIDLDDQVQLRAGRSIREIFADGGEGSFRDLEAIALREVPDSPLAVVSLGGGAILREENRHWIGQNGVCVWLDAQPETLARRIEADQGSHQQRPALTPLGSLEEIQQVLQVRRPLYQQVSDCAVVTDGKSIEQVAQEVLVKLQGLGSLE